jgi:ribosomal protein S18 acetylase RimI-like enzyme
MKSSSRSISRSNTPALKIEVRRIHRRDLNRAWEFLKLVFREINRKTVEYQRPRSKSRFFKVYDEEGTEQLLFVTQEAGQAKIVGYAECAYDITGSDNWLNERYFRSHEMRPLFVEELAVHPDLQGRGLGSFMLEQVQHLARLRGCTHIVLEVAENNPNALKFYRKRDRISRKKNNNGTRAFAYPRLEVASAKQEAHANGLSCHSSLLIF